MPNWVYNPGSGSQESTDCSSRTGFIVLSQGSWKGTGKLCCPPKKESASWSKGNETLLGNTRWTSTSSHMETLWIGFNTWSHCFCWNPLSQDCPREAAGVSHHLYTQMEGFHEHLPLFLAVLSSPVRRKHTCEKHCFWTTNIQTALSSCAIRTSSCCHQGREVVMQTLEFLSRQYNPHNPSLIPKLACLQLFLTRSGICSLECFTWHLLPC